MNTAGTTPKELQAAREDVQFQREQLQAMLDTMQDAMLSISFPDRRLLFASASIEHVFGYPLQKFLDDPDFFTQIVHPDDLERAIAAQNTCLHSGFIELDHRIIWPDGQVRWLQRRAWVNFDTSGNPVQINDIARDITERKRAEEALRHSEARYRSIVEDQTDLVCRYDTDLRLTFGNHAYCKAYGIAPGEIIGKSILEKIPIEQQEAARSYVRSLTRENPIGISVHHSIQPDGSHRLIEWKDRAIFDDMGRIIEYQGIGRDITEQKRIEAALLESEQRLRLFVEHAPAAIAMLDRHMRYLAVSRRWLIDYRLTEEDIIGRSHYDIFPDLPERWKQIHRRCLNGAIEKCDADPFPRADGTLDWVRWEIRPWHDADGIVGGILLFSEVITERKQAEEALQASEKRYRQMFELHGLPKLIVHPETGRIIDANSAATQFYGYDTATLTTLSIFDINLSPEDIVRNKMGQAIATGMQSCEFIHRVAGGHPRDVEIFTGPIEIEGQQLLYSIVTDITEKQRAQSALQAAHDLLEQRVIERTAELERSTAEIQDIYNKAPIGYHSLDASGIIIRINDTELSWLGYPREAVIGKMRMGNLLTPASYALFQQLFPIFKERGWMRDIELEMRRYDGSTFHTLLNATAVYDSDRQFLHSRSTMVDVTEIRQTQEALRESESRYRLLAENVRDVIVKISTEGIRTFVTPSCYELLGYRPEELIGHVVFEHIHPDDQPSTGTMMRQALDSDSPFFTITQRMHHKAGHYIWVEVTNTIVRDPQTAKPLEIIGVIRNITERKQAEDALRESEERYRSTINAMFEGVVVQDSAGVIQLCNAAAEQILGLATEQMMGRTSVDPRWAAIHEDGSPFPGEEHPAMLALQTGLPQSNIVMGIHKPNDELTWILVHAQPLFKQDQQQPYAVVATFTDITVRKQAEAALQQALLHEKELNELKSRFVSMASHEFRTPLAAILATTETLSVYRDRMNAAQIDERLAKIRRQVTHMKDIMEDVLQLARIQARRVEYKPISADLDALCREIVEEFESQEQYRSQILYLCNHSPMIADLDVRLMRQIIANLISNGLKYSPAGTPISVSLSHDQNRIVLMVQDHGIGIPPDDLKHIFEPFHRAANVGTVSGTGLGLSITKQAVELHGGVITAESLVDHGTTMTVMLPLHPHNNAR